MKRVYYEVEKKIETISKKGYVEVDDSYTQMYDNMARLTYNMKSLVEVQLMFFFCVESNSSGVFSTDDRMFEKFIKHSEKNGGKAITKMTFFTAIKNLTNNKIFIKLNRGQYQLNPFLIWRDSLTERTDTIATICESEENLDI